MSLFPSFLKLRLLDTRVAELREKASDQLRSVLVSSANPSLALNGSTATVVQESENVLNHEGTVEWYYLTRVVRNEHGEYILLKTTDRSPFIKHLSQARAKLLLKDKYVEPGSRTQGGDA